jgi:sigma-B regulation protein RsbU (phosphoserine phosphatase)
MSTQPAGTTSGDRFAALERELEIARMLVEVSRELTSILELDPLLDKIAEITRGFIDYELFAVLLVDAEREELVWKTSIGYSEEYHRRFERLSLHDGIVGRVARTRQPVVVDDVTVEPDYVQIRTKSGRLPASELALPLVAKDRVIGVLVVESTEKGYFQPHHVRLLTPLAAQIAIAIENATLYEIAARDAATKQMLSGIGREMTHIMELDELLNRIAVLMRRVIVYEILGIFLWNTETELLELKIAIGYDDDTIARISKLRLGQGLLGHAAEQRATIVTSDLAHDPRAIPARTIDGRDTQSEVAIPIVFRDRLLGVVVVESADARYFTAERVQVLETLATQMAVSINNAQLFQQVVQKEQKLEADFALARDLQSSMLPVAMPELEGFDIAAVYKPAESVGGDYFDFIWLEHGLLGLTIGDVSGKGVAAAMTMAATRSALRFAARVNTSPSQVLYHTNRRLFRDVKKRMFITLFYGVLDLPSRTLRWSNAGHYPPILLHADGSREELEKGGTVLAVFDKWRYTSQQTVLRSGDVLCCYTDGVIEARNPQDEEFGKERLEVILRKRSASLPKDIVKAVTAELKRYTRGAAQHDDITLFVLKARDDAAV